MDLMRKKKGFRINWLFIFAVIIPIAIGGYYYGYESSDVYISESKFVIRTPEQKSMTSGLGSLLGGGGFTRSQDDSYAVHEYILSRDALKVLDEALDLEEMFSSSDIDVLNRYGALWEDVSDETLFQYYEGRLELLLDAASSITTLKVRAFTADDAYQINELLLETTEKLVNRLNERGRNDLLQAAQDELTFAEQKAKDARLALAEYKNKTTTVDPAQQSMLQMQQVSKLQDALIQTKTQLAQLESLAASNPQVSALKTRIKEIKKEIAGETAKVTGNKNSLSSKTIEYEKLVLEQEFANERLAAAVLALKQAKDEAIRQQLYLERIAQPSKPDYPLEPRRIRLVVTVVVLSFIMWGILSLLLAGVREHHNH
jgi:capsular polysaccharide transport system permease protein